ncbi:MAG: phosphoenolpyruvate carboxylase [Kangiellaceae bacterium]|nr:phosphoenolpyruvate carboxylase [Kangiellaceae bacterium]
MSQELSYDGLRDRVRLLGDMLGETLKSDLGEEWLNTIEQIRRLGKSTSQDSNQDAQQEIQQQLASQFVQMSGDELSRVASAFSQFLNLANITEEQYTVACHQGNPIDDYLRQLKEEGVDKSLLKEKVNQLSIELVLTAHPTEVTRRTLINKYRELAEQLEQLDINRALGKDAKRVEHRIAELIAQAWHTHKIRDERPTPIDEARWGFAVIEHSLWEAVPQFVKELDRSLQDNYQINLPLDANPIKIASWMGGDRDGNPRVTAKVTAEVLLMSRWRAADLFIHDVEKLIDEISVSPATEELIALSGGNRQQPYRIVLRQLRDQLIELRARIGRKLSGENIHPAKLSFSNQQLLEPLLACYQSLQLSGLQIIADGALKDTLLRAYCFGTSLLKLDIRQDSERHQDVISELTRHLGLGDYAQWNETDKIAFLQKELNEKRPLFPRNWCPSEEVKEVLDSINVIAENDQNSFGIYIISMARSASDVLAVQLLLKESGVSWAMPVAPLFETLDDLNNAHTATKQLLSLDWYRNYIEGRQYIMIGYSDSAKDAGVLSAAWAQYSAQEGLVELAAEFDITLTLFHGRGGTIGRGGGPAHDAILSQPPGSVEGGLRVTEQGETIRYKFGMPKLAVRSLNLYASAVLEALITPPPQPKPEWRELMQQLSKQATEIYRGVVRHNSEFVPYFRQATPEQELSNLPLGSRPAKRKPGGGVESLRAIPWIFAWSQNRLVLPSWLGAMESIRFALNTDSRSALEQMRQEWPFFKSRLAMLEMVFVKSDPVLSQEYDLKLVDESKREFGESLRDKLAEDKQTLLSLNQAQELMQQDPWNKNSIKMREPYLMPLHLVQIELLKRTRANPDDKELQMALMMTIAGIAAGMRNTG